MHTEPIFVNCVNYTRDKADIWIKYKSDKEGILVISKRNKAGISINSKKIDEDVWKVFGSTLKGKRTTLWLTPEGIRKALWLHPQGIRKAFVSVPR